MAPVQRGASQRPCLLRMAGRLNLLESTGTGETPPGRGPGDDQRSKAGLLPDLLRCSSGPHPRTPADVEVPCCSTRPPGDRDTDVLLGGGPRSPFARRESMSRAFDVALFDRGNRGQGAGDPIRASAALVPIFESPRRYGCRDILRVFAPHTASRVERSCSTFPGAVDASAAVPGYPHPTQPFRPRRDRPDLRRVFGIPYMVAPAPESGQPDRW